MEPKTNPFTPRLGGILSADIAVPEHERVVEFYSSVLSTGDKPLWRKDLMNNQGAPIVGVGPRSPEYSELPLQWMPHIQVADVAASAKTALELGGKELLHGKDDSGSSQWAVILDPAGAAFGIVPPVSMDDIPTSKELPTTGTGHIAWMDLTLSEAPSIRDFYQKVIGWSIQHVGMKDGEESYADYNMLAGDGKPAAGICHARGVNVGLPPVWLIYLPVGEIEESLHRVGRNGGKVIKESKGADGRFNYAVIQDPVGAYVALAPS